MCINVEKSNIVDFRISGKIKNNEHWSIGNEVLENVEKFTYWGFFFHFNNKFTKVGGKLIDQSRKAEKIYEGCTCN